MPATGETIAIKLRSLRKRGNERLHIIEELMPKKCLMKSN
jgi:uncharacterized protein Veg